MRVGTSLCCVIAAIAVCTTAARAQTRAAPTAPAPPAVRRVAGCYRVLSIDGRADSLRTAPSALDPFARPPQYFELTDTALAAPLDGWYALHPVTLRPPQKMFATWRVIGRDSVDVGWSNGFVGLSLSLAARGDTLAGRVERTSDVHLRGQQVPLGQPIVVERLACRPR
jgi:hypothetical protein